jgi:SAM-dependent methyltransferase
VGGSSFKSVKDTTTNQINPGRDVATQHTLEFLLANFPSGNPSILEVGCGQGDLAAALAAKGHKITAIDSDRNAVKSAKSKGVNARVEDFLEYKANPFDVILFTSSLHHLNPLKDAIDQARFLLKPGGILLIDDFSLEAPNAQTLKWYYGLSTAIKAMSGHPAAEQEMAEQEMAEQEMAVPESEIQERWKKEHEHTPPLHTGSRILEEVKRRFELLVTERGPYLYRSLIKELENNASGFQAVKAALDWESDLILKQIIRPVGLRIAAVPISK